MARNGSGFIITGQSGSGKSTSCLQLLRSGYQYLGDDYIWVEQSGEAPSVHMLFQTAKVEPDNFERRFPDWASFITNRETYRDQKAIFHIHEHFPELTTRQARVNAILLPRVTGERATTFEKASPSGALFAMAPTTLHHLPHKRDISYQKLKKLTSDLPAYQWKLGYDPGEFLQSFIDFTSHEFSWN